MSECNIDQLIAWLYILCFFLGIMIIVGTVFLIATFVLYKKTGFHISDWLEKKFNQD